MLGQRFLYPLQRLFQSSANTLRFAAVAQTPEFHLHIPHHSLHHLLKGLVLRRIDAKAAAVAGDGQEVGVDFAAHASPFTPPHLHAEILFPDDHALDPHLDAHFLGGGLRAGHEDDLAMDGTEGRPFEDGDAMTGKACRYNAHAVDKDRKVLGPDGHRLQHTPPDLVRIEGATQARQNHASAVAALTIRG